MKKALALTLALSVILLPVTTSAHPGRTDKKGGHTCYTNCEKWGLKYGEYHFHNSGGSSSGGSSSGESGSSYTSPITAPKAQYNVFQYTAYLNSFGSLEAAISYAKNYNSTSVVNIDSGVMTWDNYRSQVFQYNKYLGDFSSRTAAIAYAKKFDHTKVIDLESKKIFWHNWPRAVYQYDKYLQSFSDQYQAQKYANLWDHALIVDTLTGEVEKINW
ncbi:hypothetical protein CIG75_15940 [Tumebacillus algifaecis]|uniref:YHYH domain-containing protein n=1 Tax=Tumebacillus algifaecis TaxID=1214604 RepID=A0A223D3U1_9BACL|nr:YHYH domain-containing protein [Tumebacillus algifaecis]ASS76288.1 hypothetical protein CIG75_15940 [Tumebacillus algifaecis]